MTKAVGVTLESLWPQLSSSQKASIQSQLNGIFSALRSVPVDSGGPTGAPNGRLRIRYLQGHEEVPACLGWAYLQ